MEAIWQRMTPEEQRAVESDLANTDNCTTEPPLVQAHPSRQSGDLGPPLTLEQCKARHVALVLAEANWNVSLAARWLAIHRRTLTRMIRDYELKKPEKRT